MLQLDGLAQAAEDLRSRGIDADHVVLFGSHGGVEGLEVCDDFFPLWELLLPTNRDAVDRLDFAAIKLARGPNWSLDLHMASATGG